MRGQALQSGAGRGRGSPAEEAGFGGNRAGLRPIALRRVRLRLSEPGPSSGKAAEQAAPWRPPGCPSAASAVFVSHNRLGFPHSPRSRRLPLRHPESRRPVGAPLSPPVTPSLGGRSGLRSPFTPRSRIFRPDPPFSAFSPAPPGRFNLGLAAPLTRGGGTQAAGPRPHKTTGGEPWERGGIRIGQG